MASTNILGLIIYLPMTYEDYPLLGIYGDQIRLSETPVTFVDPIGDYTAGYIAKNGIGSINKNSDFSTGGNVLNVSNVEISLLNKQRYYVQLKELEINLTGLMVQIREFIGDPTDHASVSSEYIYTGYITDLQVSSTEITFTLKASLTESRRANIGQLITLETYPYAPESNIDKILPVMFGNSDPLNKRFFKLLRTTAKNDILQIIDTVLYSSSATFNPFSYLYPVITNLGDVTVRLLMGYALNADDLTDSVNTDHPGWFNDLFLFCTQGPNGTNGTAREIVDYFLTGEVMPDMDIFLEVEVRDYWPAPPQGNADFNATDQTYFELHDVDIKYSVSGFDVLGFFDSVTGVAQTINYDLFGPIDGGIEKLMSSGIEYTTSGNVLDMNPRIFNGTELLKLANYDCYPANRIDKMIREDFDAVGITGYDVILPSALPAAGLSGAGSGYTVSAVNVTGSYFNAIDRQTGSGHRWINVFTGIDSPANGLSIGYKIKFPVLPEDYKFTKCYLGVNLKTNIDKGVVIAGSAPYRVFLQPSKVTGEFNPGAVDFTSVNIDNIPDFYYFTDPLTRNKNFFLETADTSGGTYNVRGHKLFEIEASNVKDLLNIDWVSVVVTLTPDDTTTYTVESIFEEACFIFEREQDIGNEIYV